MSERPYTILSACVSLDGYLDDAGAERLRLSGPADFDRVDGVRASCDAILVGAGTLRADDPRLLVRSAERRATRLAAGLPESPARVSVTSSGAVDPGARFFTTGSGTRLVYAASAVATHLSRRLARIATVVDAGGTPSVARIGEDLAKRGIERMLVEGGGAVLTQFLAHDLADELHLAVAPVFVGDAAGARLVHPARFPWRGDRRADLVDVTAVGDVAVMRYALSERFAHPAAPVPVAVASAR